MFFVMSLINLCKRIYVLFSLSKKLVEKLLCEENVQNNVQ